MGYIIGTTSYRIWDQQHRKIIKTRDVIFPKVENSIKELEMVNLEISKENGPKVEFFEVKEEDSKDFEEGGNMEHPQAPLPLQQLPENLENQAQNRNLSPQPRQQPRQNLQPRQNFENRFLQPRQEEQPRRSSNDNVPWLCHNVPPHLAHHPHLSISFFLIHYVALRL